MASDNNVGFTRFLPSGLVGRRWWAVGVRWSSGLLLGAVVFYWIFLRYGADASWWGTVLAFSPRWPLALPLAILLPAALLMRQWKALTIQVLAAGILIGPVMGFRFSGLGSECPTLSGLNLRVLTCNLQGDSVDLERFQSALAEVGPDLVAIQEYPHSLAQAVFPEEDWFVVESGEFCVASRYPIQSFQSLNRRTIGGWGDFAIVCRVNGPEGHFEFVNLHLSSVRHGIERLRASRFEGASDAAAVFERRRYESQAIRNCLNEIKDPVLVVGDFNMPVESVIYSEYWASYRNLFSEAGRGFGATFKTSWHGVRIDPVLADGNWKPICCRVGPNIGSDHLPLVAELRHVASPVDELP